jgi:hypothetical protein
MRFKIFSKRPERRDCMPYYRISQADLEHFFGFFVTAELDIAQGFSREVATEESDCLR